MAAIELTGFVKRGGPLTKRISLGPDGEPVSDGSACVMSAGSAERVKVANIQELAELIGGLKSNHALALGMLRPGLPDEVEIATKTALDKLNGTPRPDLIARTGANIFYREQPTYVLFDHDTKGMPKDVEQRIHALGWFGAALMSVLPALANVACIVRKSTSSGLFRSDTNERFADSGGWHIFAQIQDGTDAERFLKALHERCWLAGLGWKMVGAGGQLLDRSIIDHMVFGPERLVFEGPPDLVPPLGQDQHSRTPVAHEGDVLDTVATCPPLSIVEQAKLKELRAKEAHRLAPESAKAREAFIRDQAKRHSVPPEVIARQCEGVLLPPVVLAFDDEELAGTTVADVLADPARFEGATLADPLEGVEYGRCKAKIMRRADGTPWIHSFAHGRTVYELKLDAAAVEAALNKAEKDQISNTFVRLALCADLDADQLERLRDLTAQRAGVGKRAIDRKLKAATQEQRRQLQQEEQNRRTAERQDPRPRIEVPNTNAEWLPHMQVLNEVLGKIDEPEPPMRDNEGFSTAITCNRVPLLHTLTAPGSNSEETDETRLPAPEQPLLTRFDEIQLAELIEHYIEYYDPKTLRPVHLPGPFVTHFLRRRDNALPTVLAVASMPMVLPDGSILSGHGLDRRYGVVFRVPRELQALLPRQEDCTATAVAEAMRFLTDEWLCDVATDYQGKCTLVAMTLTILERLLLPERPAFFITAGQRGGGKTTAVNMISMAALGARAAAAAWSPNEEECRKALFAYLITGIPLLMWDNIPRGAAISCPSIEKALTTAQYSDRVLCEVKHPQCQCHLSHGVHRQQRRPTWRLGVPVADCSSVC